jgi:hypothetical protein
LRDEVADERPAMKRVRAPDHHARVHRFTSAAFPRSGYSRSRTPATTLAPGV